VRGQYGGYRQVDGVDPDSTVETYVAVRLAAETWRWAGVPILIWAGKCLPVTATEIIITFKPPPHDVFGIEPVTPEDMLRFRTWPETAAGLTVHRKKPGAGWEPQAEELGFAQQPGRTSARMTGSSARRWTGTAGCSRGRPPWKPPGRSSTRYSAMPSRCTPTPGQLGAQGETERLLADREAWYDPAG
jgi:Glucose-6-phosphate dehydrogenase, C-terminal domain